MALNFGNLLLNLLGRQDPRQAVAAAALQPGAPVATPGTAPGAGATTAPGWQDAARRMAGAQPQAYQTAPDLLSLYTELTDRQNREKRIDTGLGLMAGSIVQPQNKELVAQMFGGGGSGSESDALDLILGIQAQQREAQERERAEADKQRRLKSLPAIAETYDIDMDTARALFDADQIDDFIMEKSKYHAADTSVVKDEATGQQKLINNATGETIMELGGGLAPKTEVITDDRTGQKRLINSVTGEDIKDLGGGKTTEDLTELAQVNSEREAEGLPPHSTEEWLEIVANLRKPQTTVNVDTGIGARADLKLLEETDKKIAEQFFAGQSSLDAVTSVQQARRMLNAPGGVIAGNLAAPPTLEARKIFGSIFGIDDAAVANTEAFQSSLRGIVRAKIKDLGTGNAISNSDREFLEKEVGANTTLSIASIKRIMNILEVGERNRLLDLNSRMEQRLSASPEDSPLRQAIQMWEVPDLSPEAEAYIVENVPAGHRQVLLEAINNPTATDEEKQQDIKDFERLYGRGSADIVLRTLQ